MDSVTTTTIEPTNQPTSTSTTDQTSTSLSTTTEVASTASTSSPTTTTGIDSTTTTTIIDKATSTGPISESTTTTAHSSTFSAMTSTTTGSITNHRPSTSATLPTGTTTMSPTLSSGTSISTSTTTSGSAVPNSTSTTLGSTPTLTPMSTTSSITSIPLTVATSATTSGVLTSRPPITTETFSSLPTSSSQSTINVLPASSLTSRPSFRPIATSSHSGYQDTSTQQDPKTTPTGIAYSFGWHDWSADSSQKPSGVSTSGDRQSTVWMSDWTALSGSSTGPPLPTTYGVGVSADWASGETISKSASVNANHAAYPVGSSVTTTAYAAGSGGSSTRVESTMTSVMRPAAIGTPKQSSTTDSAWTSVSSNDSQESDGLPGNSSVEADVSSTPSRTASSPTAISTTTHSSLGAEDHGDPDGQNTTVEGFEIYTGVAATNLGRELKVAAGVLIAIMVWL